MPAIGFCLESEANFVKKSEKTCDERSFEREYRCRDVNKQEYSAIVKETKSTEKRYGNDFDREYRRRTNTKMEAVEKKPYVKDEFNCDDAVGDIIGEIKIRSSN
ncbi:hypothetical protein PGB90_005054 [Kerria lacca]